MVNRHFNPFKCVLENSAPKTKAIRAGTFGINQNL